MTRSGGHSLGRNRSFGIEHGAQPVDHRRKTDGRENHFLGDALAAKDLLVRIDAEPAAIDRRNGRTPKFKISRIHAMGA